MVFNPRSQIMIHVECPKCQTKYRFDEKLLKGKKRASARCKKCGEKIEVTAADPAPAPDAHLPTGEAPVRQDTTARMRKMRSDEPVSKQDKTMSDKEAVDILELPTDKKYSLAALQGKASGRIFTISKSRTTIGRAGSDIALDDPECSRQHAVLEIQGSRNIIRDLDSTNGTFVDGQRKDLAELENHSEFRVGDHVLMLIITSRD